MVLIIENWLQKVMETIILCKCIDCIYEICILTKTYIYYFIYFVATMNYLWMCSKSEIDADFEIERIFKILGSQENDLIRPRTITHLGRDLTFIKTCGQVLNSTFDELCDRVCYFLYLCFSIFMYMF